MGIHKQQEGHKLVWSLHGEGTERKCGLCQQGLGPSEGRWECKTEALELCKSCGTPGKCAKGHNLKWSTFAEDEYMFGIYVCKRCQNNGLCKDGRWFCQTCQHDICAGCFKLALPSAASSPKETKIICEICCTNEVQFTLEPCKHQLCAFCVAQLQECPFDRIKIRKRVQIDLPS